MVLSHRYFSEIPTEVEVLFPIRETEHKQFQLDMLTFSAFLCTTGSGQPEGESGGGTSEYWQLGTCKNPDGQTSTFLHSQPATSGRGHMFLSSQPHRPSLHTVSSGVNGIDTYTCIIK